MRRRDFLPLIDGAAAWLATSARAAVVGVLSALAALT
jgi:hypothetical protein